MNKDKIEALKEIFIITSGIPRARLFGQSLGTSDKIIEEIKAYTTVINKFYKKNIIKSKK